MTARTAEQARFLMREHSPNQAYAQIVSLITEAAIANLSSVFVPVSFATWVRNPGSPEMKRLIYNLEENGFTISYTAIDDIVEGKVVPRCSGFRIGWAL